MAYAGAPLGFGFGPNLLGPTLMVWGSEEQKRRHLTDVLHAARLIGVRASASPAPALTSPRCRPARCATATTTSSTARKSGHPAPHGRLDVPARPHPSRRAQAPRHLVFLVDMQTPGITFSRSRTSTSGHVFNQVFFDNVRVPRANLVGEENRGWYVATTTLDFERSGINRVTWARRQLEDVIKFLQESGRSVGSSPKLEVTRIKLAELLIELDIARLLCYRVAWLQTQGKVPNYESSMAKLYERRSSPFLRARPSGSSASRASLSLEPPLLL